MPCRSGGRAHPSAVPPRAEVGTPKSNARPHVLSVHLVGSVRPVGRGRREEMRLLAFRALPLGGLIAPVLTLTTSKGGVALLSGT